MRTSLDGRGCAVENVAASVVKQEAVSQPLSCAIWTSTNHMVGMVVVDGLPLFGGAQLAVDTTLVSTLHADGSTRRRAADEDGVALAAARRVKETPSWPRARARLVCVSGRWSVSLLARAKARCEVWLLQHRLNRLLPSCTVVCAVVHSFLELPGASGADGDTPPLHEVERTFARLL